MKERVFDIFKEKWKNDINVDKSMTGNGSNKLRVYNKFKEDYNVEHYNKLAMSRQNRRAIALFRCGAAPIRLETGRYTNLPENERVCFNCKDCVEDEMHVLLKCPVYNNVRNDL